MAEETQNQSANTDKWWQFKPGVSGNPGGRPKGTFSIRRMIAEKMRENPEEAKLLVSKIYERAMKDCDSKEFKYVETIIESIDGKLSQPIDQTSTHTDLSEFSAEDLQAFREWLKERKAAESE